MATEESFLQAIRDEPDDDGLRLIFADWLEERGDVRGTLMRLQVTRSALAAEDPSRPELERQEKELLERYKDCWLGALLWRLRDSHFQRGLLHVEANGSLVEPPLPRGSAAAWVERLNLWSVSTAQVGQLANCRYLTALTMLDLHFGRLGDLAAALLAGSAALAPLRWLDLSGNAIGDEGAKELACSPHLTRLRALHLSANVIGPAGAHALAGSQALSSLKTLDLSYNHLGDRGAVALAASPHLAGLRALYLSGNDIRLRGIRALTSSPYLTNLNALHLSGNPVGEAGGRLLHQHFGAAVRS
ncbi:MAG: TIGR02996 domain-containing protein [Planctomycetes bacterium]|nr:TIGR02996 domain-containing protein [Planctomycetota bacterium]